MLSNQVPSLQAMCITQLSPDAIDDLNQLCMPELPTLKERTNIRVLGIQNPITIVTDTELKQKISDLNDEYIYMVVSGYYPNSPRSQRINQPLPELRTMPEHNFRYSKVDFYDYYFYDHKLAKTKWEDAEERLDPDGSYDVYTKHQFYDYYKNIKIAEVKWRTATHIKHVTPYGSRIDIFHGLDALNDYSDYDHLSDMD